ncbi:probable ATP-dependent RNA helicase DDX31 [Conger conger]|uniref:probable ATP-dependent RNA helicase DDX31 n=1 Tax=Conger conger TaxID=82655 RepID=UPI002A5ACF61|nr:probable ATP-dependent RNA helicase DDX31 [Conger conger]XP_061115867.1 probable ATP-dependent RNA helicase DDX31 [Conger conger]XP_061115868.1 probable ATP-dependent RNA helicase DDX31 [Conger conger]XP_061115869.1 probable ATP-dependent RNA helicase DDX31 [Conger conger]
MAEDTLMLNITNSTAPTFNIGNKKFKRPFKPADKWKKKRAEKRKASERPQEAPPSKQKPQPGPQQKPSKAQKEEPSKRCPKSPPVKPIEETAKKEGSQTRPGKRAQNSTGPSRPQQRSQLEERRDEERPFIKTSSLFRNNPDIPDIHRSEVTQVKEKVFTSDSFAELELHPHLLSTLNNVLKVTSMTSVQKETIPVLLNGRDAVVRSQTGSGKTLAYGIPLVQSLQATQPKIKRGDGPLAVIVVPTRELAQQSFQIIQKLLKPFTWIVPGVLMGGEKRKSEKARLRKGINILISTPGRLVDHINNTLSIAFSAVRWLILDEADRTLDLGFEKDLTVILNALNATGPARQNVLLSATLTEGVSRLANISLKEPVSIQVSEHSAAAGLTSDPGAVMPDPAGPGLTENFAVPEKLQQHVVVVPSKLRLVCLAAFILGKCKFESGNKLIVFLSSCEAVEFLLSLFTTVLCGKADPAASPEQRPPLAFLRLHGNMAQEERTEVFQEFSQAKTGILLCTDVAARGLDLPQVTWIIQYTPPVSAAEYVHRVGRTARIGTRGNSLLFLTPSETTYLNVLANHNIGMSEMVMEDILANLMLDDRFKGRGKWDNKRSSGALQQEIRERATVLQTDFENVVHANKDSVQTAKKALQSFLRAYTTYPTSVKHVFHIRHLHLGHAAKSFGLRDAPQGLSCTGAGARGGKERGKEKGKGKEKRPPRTLSGKERVASLMRSEYASGAEDCAPKKKKRKKRQAAEGEQTPD